MHEKRMTTGGINQVFFALNLKFVHGPAVGNFFTQEMVKIKKLATPELLIL